MDVRNEAIRDYYILPALEFSADQLKLSEENAGFLDGFRTDTLDYLLKLSVNISLDKAVHHGAWAHSAYSH
jgi:hypothetical protein